MMRVVLAVTGGRDLTREHFDAGMAQLAEHIDAPPGEAVIAVFHGAARGWDTHADDWARERSIVRHPIPYDAGAAEGVPRAQWGKRRNHYIMRDAKAMGRAETCDVFVLAGWNGMSAGTAHGIGAAAWHGLDVVMYKARK